MWIKWKYMDHGHPDFKELEVPDDVKENYGSIADYICEIGLVPTWSERFLIDRIKWQKIEYPSIDTVSKKLKEAESMIEYQTKRVKKLKDLHRKIKIYNI